MSSSISQAFKSLNVAIADSPSEHENIYDVSYQYLSNVKNFNDGKSLHNCLVALINMDKYQKALQLLKKAPEEVHQDFVIEKAYIYYKTGNTDLLETLYNKTIESGDYSEITLRAITHIMAQNHYKEGNNAKVLDLYHGLISSNQDIDNLLDLACNERAIISQGNFMNSNGFEQIEPKSTLEEEDVTYDLIFNDSLILLSQGKREEALELLSKAESICKVQNMDSDDFLVEVTPIRLTIAYIHQIQGDPQGVATNILSTMMNDQAVNNDVMTKLILTNNYYSIKNNKLIDNTNLIERQLNLQQNLHLLQHKLTKPQFQTLIKNNLILSYGSGTLTKKSSYLSKKFINNWISTFYDDYTPYIYKILKELEINYEDLISDQRENSANSRQFYKYATKVENLKEIELFIAAVLLLAVSEGKEIFKTIEQRYSRSILLIEKYLQNQFELNSKVSIVLLGLLIQIYETKEKYPPILMEFSNKFSIKHCENDIHYYNFAKVVAFILFPNYDKVYSETLFGKLLEINPNDDLIKSILNGDSIDLATISDLTKNTKDVDELINIEIEDLYTERVKRSNNVQKPNTKSFKIKKNKKSTPKFSKTKKIIPSSEFDEDSLDKERWLPLKLRSYYKPTKKDKKKAGGHQGAISPEPVVSSNTQKKKKKGKK
ncbi:signal recognition particle subunit Srp72p [[Candida] anglica]|uniref:Signal recognition particle subunit SRP72 n=1 Tax=[Candida] anglica TaxID=148631 RepID=A0ABP0ECD4_9ASCO